MSPLPREKGVGEDPSEKSLLPETVGRPLVPVKMSRESRRRALHRALYTPSNDVLAHIAPWSAELIVAARRVIKSGGSTHYQRRSRPSLTL
jgi:hypothetical protein